MADDDLHASLQPYSKSLDYYPWKQSTTMVSMALMAVWGTVDFFLLAAGGVMIAFSILWRAPDAFRNLVMTEMDLTGTWSCLPSSARLSY
jgi:hypothetical protein